MTENRLRRSNNHYGDARPAPYGPPRESRAALISVVIPCYNQAQFLSEAIESVLAQTYPHFEILVVDDGSTDNTSEVAASYPEVRCIRQDNRGLAEARNTGLHQSHGDYLVFLDADDRLLPEALEAGLKCFDAHPEYAFVFGQYSDIAANGCYLSTPRPRYAGNNHYTGLLRFGNYIGMHATVMYRRSVLEAARGFDPSLGACEDYNLYLRLAREHPVRCHGKVVAQYRQHEAQMSHNAALMLNTSVSVLRSQWKHIEGSKQHEKAYKAGMIFWQERYGPLLVKEVLNHLLKREWGRAMRRLLVLMCYPRAFVLALQRARRKLALYIPLRRWLAFSQR